ncbi:MAG: phosphate transport system regulatory protein PhoU [Alphaproteobacteria bacterium]|nr:MAG: phosphate transport system regulatory protein PhoU [Alphaproteobacteria bacterium]
MTSQHTLQVYDEDLERLRAHVSQMAALADEELADAVRALVERDSALAESVVQRDRTLDAMEAEGERKAIEIIALRAPVADDLREIMAIVKIINALERVGDYAKNIAKRTTVLIGTLPDAPSQLLPVLAEEVRGMLAQVIDAFIGRDTKAAVAVWQSDAKVDALYTSLFRELLTYMVENPRRITAATHLLFIAKNLERVGDQATNIAELVYFMVEGEQLPDERPKSDESAVITAPGDEGDGEH